MKTLTSFDYLYVESLIMIILIMLTLLYFQIRNTQKYLNGMCFVFYTGIALSILDIIWVFVDGKPQFINLNVIINVLDLSIMLCIGLAWLVSVLEIISIKKKTYNWIRIVGILIVLITSAVHIISGSYTGWTFWVDEMGYYHRGPYHLFGTIIALSFLVFGSILSNRSRKLATFSNERRRFSVLTIFPIPLVLIALSQSFMPVGTPNVQFGLIIGLIILYSTSQDNKITRDYLTKLPNRFSFEESLQKAISKYNPNGVNQLFILAGDLNNFKNINDTYGHPEGDKALICVANILDEIFSNSVEGGMVSRTGGDEFLGLIACNNKGTVDKIIEDINESLDVRSQSLPYHLSMSIGYIAYEKGDSLQEALAKVDDSLYDVKRLYKEKKLR